MIRLWRLWKPPRKISIQGTAIIPRRVLLPVQFASLGGLPCPATLPPVSYRYPLEGGRAQVDLFDRSVLPVQEYPNRSYASFAKKLETTSPNALGYLPYYNEKRLPIARLISAAARRLVKLSLWKVCLTVPGHYTTC
jgi:hypothetical protein